MDDAMTNEERERIRQQLEKYCLGEPIIEGGQSGQVRWGYQAVSSDLNHDLDTMPEIVQPTQWQHTVRSFGERPAESNARNREIAVPSAKVENDWQVHAAIPQNGSVQLSPTSGPPANEEIPLSVSAATPSVGRRQESLNQHGSRWFGIRGILGDDSASMEAPIAQKPSHIPVLAAFSLDGGVGKTCMAATLGRKLSARGERVLLMETTPYGLLPFFFGARDRRPGAVRTFRPPASSTDAPLQTISSEPDALLADGPGPAQFPPDIAAYAQSCNRVIIDLPTAAVTTVRQILHMAPVILVPMLPDMKSVLGAGSIESLLRPSLESPDKQAEIYYLLNQFDASLPLHVDVRDALQKRLGNRLLPFTLRREPAISEALAEGMSVLDYAPDSPIVEDFNRLEEWIESVAAPATAAAQGARWNESA